MTTITAGRWLLVALAIVGLALAATAVSAHGTDTTIDRPHNGTDAPTTIDHPHNGTDAPPYGGSAEEWDGWMESHATGHGGHGADTHLHGMHADDVHRDDAHTDDVHRDDVHTDDVHGDDTHRDGVQGNGHGMGSRGHGC